MKNTNEDANHGTKENDNTTNELGKTQAENYPSVFFNKKPSQDLKKLRGKQRRFQAGKN